MKTMLMIIFGVLLLLILAYFGRQIWLSKVSNNQKQSTVSIKIFDNKKMLGRFQVELADTALKQARGLMFREHLAENEGMLFIFSHEQSQTFWMKFTKIPLDMIFFSEEKKVVDIINDAKPCAKDNCAFYNSKKKSKYVLEINAGLAKKLGIKEGSVLELSD